MQNNNEHREPVRDDFNLAHTITRVAGAAQADAVICTTESIAFAQHLYAMSGSIRVIIATTNKETFDNLTQDGMEVLRLALRAADKYNQVRHVISVALRSQQVAIGDLVVCAIDRDLYPAEGTLLVITEVEASLEHLAVADLLKLTDGIRPQVLEAAILVARRVGRAARRGKRIGTILTLGDSLKVLEESRQLIPNPFHGHDESLRKITNPAIHEALVELSKLDGAFILRGDGFIQTAGAFLTSPQVEIELPAGLGARHVAAAVITAHTAATTVVVSATDGNVRVFSDGRMVMQMDPDVPYGLLAVDE